MRLDGKVVGAALGCTLAFGYIVCVLYDLAFGQQMYREWMAILPNGTGFRWISPGSFMLGLVEAVVYGLVAGLVFAPLYNFFLVKCRSTRREASVQRKEDSYGR
jgi:hypothetical protein